MLCGAKAHGHRVEGGTSFCRNCSKNPKTTLGTHVLGSPQITQHCLILIHFQAIPAPKQSFMCHETAWVLPMSVESATSSIHSLAGAADWPGGRCASSLRPNLGAPFFLRRRTSMGLCCCGALSRRCGLGWAWAWAWDWGGGCAGGRPLTTRWDCFCGISCVAWWCA